MIPLTNKVGRPVRDKPKIVVAGRSVLETLSAGGTPVRERQLLLWPELDETPHVIAEPGDL